MRIRGYAWSFASPSHELSRARGWRADALSTPGDTRYARITLDFRRSARKSELAFTFLALPRQSSRASVHARDGISHAMSRMCSHGMRVYATQACARPHRVSTSRACMRTCVGTHAYAHACTCLGEADTQCRHPHMHFPGTKNLV